MDKICQRCKNEENTSDANFCKLCGLDLRLLYSASLDKSYTMIAVDEFFEDCRMPILEFADEVEDNLFSNYDGHGRYANATQESNIYVCFDEYTLREIAEEGIFTHVMWYNK